MILTVVLSPSSALISKLPPKYLVKISAIPIPKPCPARGLLCAPWYRLMLVSTALVEKNIRALARL